MLDINKADFNKFINNKQYSMSEANKMKHCKKLQWLHKKIQWRSEKQKWREKMITKKKVLSDFQTHSKTLRFWFRDAKNHKNNCFETKQIYLLNYVAPQQHTLLKIHCSILRDLCQDQLQYKFQKIYCKQQPRKHPLA